jgi:pimeloyl-ACP methyl ester carboxylesterase
MSQSSLLTLKDGRKLEYLTNGVESDKAILFLHGTPGSALAWNSYLPEVKGIRAISTSRAGYGLSDRHKGRSVADNLFDQQQILDHFGIKEFVSIGWSGGGPHSLNMTRDARCKAAFTLAGVGEWGNADLDFLADMGPENHEEFGEALKGEVAIEEWMKANALGYNTIKGSELIEAFGGLIGDADKRALTPEVAEVMAIGMRHSNSVSFYGWLDDDLAFVRDFGFDITKIDKPVVLYQGDDDFMVPHAHGYWLEKKIPTAKLNFVPGHGHISLIFEYRDQIIKEALEFLGA